MNGMRFMPNTQTSTITSDTLQTSFALSPESLGISSKEDAFYAAIDLGSNSFHMIVARQTHGQVQIVDKHKEMVRLRAGLDSKNNLTVSAFEHGIACLERFGQRIKDIPAENIRAVGTNTLRNAKNSKEFLAQARKALGHSIQIIAGQEEARLIYLGVAHGLPKSDEQRLVMDIGGGSTEYIIGKGIQNSHLTSTEMGCVSMTQAFFDNDQITLEKMADAITKCRQILRPHVQQLKQQSWDCAFGASGTIKAIGQILEQNQWSEGGITFTGLQKLTDKLIAAGGCETAKIEGLKDERKPVLAGGLAILMATFMELEIDVMQVSANALREGLIYDTLGRLYADDARNSSVRALQKWMRVDEAHGEQVAQTALSLFKQSHNVWRLHGSDYNFVQLLTWASQLYECGKAISYKRYRHHSAYLIYQSELAGFDQQEKQILSLLTLHHRGKFNRNLFSEFDEELAQQLTYLALILRLATRIHRGRDQNTPEPTLVIMDHDQIHLEFENNWLEEHPLSRLDLETEAQNLADAGFELTLT